MYYKLSVPRNLLLLSICLIMISCKEYLEDRNLVSEWELIHIYHSDHEGDILKNDTSNLIMIFDEMIIDNYGNFIMNLLTTDEKIKGKFVEDEQNNGYLRIEDVNNNKYKGLYKYDIFREGGVVYLNLESDNVVIYARKNPIIIDF